MPYLEPHDRTIDNAINRELNNAYKASVAHGRWMFAIGVVVGMLVTLFLS